jgi:hypothetical protein
MEAGNITIPLEFSLEAKSFLEACCSNVIRKNEEFHIKENFRLFGQRIFYSNYVDKMGIKFFLYKIKEYKLRIFAEDNFLKNSLNINNEKRQIWEEAKKDTHTFLKSVTKSVLSKYRLDTLACLFSIVRIQRRFRNHLKALISKMEMMNQELELESKKAIERTRRKTIQKKEESKAKK